jgi:protein-L-isoaspartate(D-aspartate) O-methyltransferase
MHIVSDQTFDGFFNYRNKMVIYQLIPQGISCKPILEAFRKVERHRFVPNNVRGEAYQDRPLPIGENQTISQPYIVALMTECLEPLIGKERVLEIGTGSGYQTAILAELSGEVYTIERIDILSEKAKALLDEIGYRNIFYKTADGSLGWQEQAPFDRIIIAAATPQIPEPLIEQLKEGGKMVLPVGETGSSQVLTLVEKRNGNITTREICDCVFVPLIGQYGSKPSRLKVQGRKQHD